MLYTCMVPAVCRKSTIQGSFSCFLLLQYCSASLEVLSRHSAVLSLARGAQSDAEVDDVRCEVAIMEMLQGHPTAVQLHATYEDEDVSIGRCEIVYGRVSESVSV